MKRMSKKAIDEIVANLRNDHVDAKPVDMDWSMAGSEDFDPPPWQSYEAVRCEKCGEAVFVGGGDGNTKHNRIDEPDVERPDDWDCDGYVGPAEGPMMNYWYPCEWGDWRDDARRIVDLPLCLVEVSGTKGLALTGGGMNLSWEICEAYVHLGFLPPVHYAGDLPQMAFGAIGEGKWLVLAAAKRSAEIALRWAQNHVENVARTEKWLRKLARQYATRDKAKK